MSNMRMNTVLAVVAGLTTLMVGCGAPAPEQNTAAPTTVATAVLPTPTQAVAEAAPITESVESAEVAESAAVAPAEEAAGEEALPVTGEDEAATEMAAETAALPAEAPSANWEEGPITFKSPSLHGAMTASGEPFDKDALTAAHKELPFGAEVTVINLFNGKQVTVIVNDRLPPQVSAVIDLSPAAAEAIDMVDAGIVDGRIEW